MELSTIRNPAVGLTPDACRFALQPIVGIQGPDEPDRGPAPWHEALIRSGEAHGMYSPGALVEFLYGDGGHVRTDVEILERLTGWLGMRQTPTRLSVNVHPDSLTHTRFMIAALKALESVQATGHRLCLELVEFGHCRERHRLIENANQLRKKGATIALDDFGSRLNFFDLCAAGIVDVVKIDSSVTRGIDRCRNKQAIARGIATLADGLEAAVVAEGIETEQQLSLVRELGIAYGQGYLFSKPALEEGI